MKSLQPVTYLPWPGCRITYHPSLHHRTDRAAFADLRRLRSYLAWDL